jgi:hypothetical protein
MTAAASPKYPASSQPGTTCAPRIPRAMQLNLLAGHPASAPRPEGRGRLSFLRPDPARHQGRSPDSSHDSGPMSRQRDEHAACTAVTTSCGNCRRRRWPNPAALDPKAPREGLRPPLFGKAERAHAASPAASSRRSTKGRSPGSNHRPERARTTCRRKAATPVMATRSPKRIARPDGPDRASRRTPGRQPALAGRSQKGQPRLPETSLQAARPRATRADAVCPRPRTP